MARYAVGLVQEGDLATVVSALENEGASMVDTGALRRVGALLAEFADDVAPEHRATRLAALPGVEYAEVVRLRGQLLEDS